MTDEAKCLIFLIFITSRKTAPLSGGWLIAASQESQTLIKAMWQERR